MKKLIVSAALAAVMAAAPASAQYSMTYYLTDQWVTSTGNRMCQYSNGTVLNVGYRVCPLSIRG